MEEVFCPQPQVPPHAMMQARDDERVKVQGCHGSGVGDGDGGVGEAMEVGPPCREDGPQQDQDQDAGPDRGEREALCQNIEGTRHPGEHLGQQQEGEMQEGQPGEGVEVRGDGGGTGEGMACREGEAHEEEEEGRQDQEGDGGDTEMGTALGDGKSHGEEEEGRQDSTTGADREEQVSRGQDLEGMGQEAALEMFRSLVGEEDSKKDSGAIEQGFILALRWWRINGSKPCDRAHAVEMLRPVLIDMIFRNLFDEEFEDVVESSGLVSDEEMISIYKDATKLREASLHDVAPNKDEDRQDEKGAQGKKAAEDEVADPAPAPAPAPVVMVLDDDADVETAAAAAAAATGGQKIVASDESASKQGRSGTLRGDRKERSEHGSGGSGKEKRKGIVIDLTDENGHDDVGHEGSESHAQHRDKRHRASKKATRLDSDAEVAAQAQTLTHASDKRQTRACRKLKLQSDADNKGKRALAEDGSGGSRGAGSSGGSGSKAAGSRAAQAGVNAPAAGAGGGVVRKYTMVEEIRVSRKIGGRLYNPIELSICEEPGGKGGTRMAYMLDTGNRGDPRIVVVRRQDGTEFVVGSNSDRELPEDGRLETADCVALSPDNAWIYVTEMGGTYNDGKSHYGHRVVVYDENGKYIAHFGEYGADPGQLTSPGGIACLPGGIVFVNDMGNCRLQVFQQDPQGEGGGEWTFIGETGSEGSDVYNFHPDGMGCVAARSGDDENTEIFAVCDTFNHRVQVFNLKDGFLCSIGQGGGRGKLKNPYGVAISPTCEVMVTETEENIKCVKVYMLPANQGEEPVLVHRFGKGMETDVDLGVGKSKRGPQGVAVDGEGRVLISNTDRGVIQIFSPV